MLVYADFIPFSKYRYFPLRRLFAAISQSAVVFSQFFRSVSAVWTKHIQNREAKCDKNHINQSIYEIGETAVSQWVHSLSLPTLTWKWVIHSISMSKRMILILYALSQVLTSVRLWNQLQANCLFKQWWNFSWFILKSTGRKMAKMERCQHSVA